MSADQDKELHHLAPSTRNVLDLTVEERVWFAREDRWIGYSAANAALAAMADLVRRPRTTTSPAMLLLGRPGNGKTTILERFASQFQPRTTQNGDLVVDVVRMAMPAGATEKDLWSELLQACQTCHRATDPAALLLRQAYAVLGTLEPRIIISDEINNLLSGSGVNQRLILGKLKDLTNRFRMHLILAGTQDAQAAVLSDEQLKRRLDRFELPKWTLNAEFLRLLRSLEKVLPLPAPSGLADQQAATLISLRTDGSIGSIARLVKEAAVLAIRNGRDRIDLDMLQSVRVETDDARNERARSL
ncbi:TniB family NTP-binding protein [Gluconacetobacter tumulisoli]|uniref:AAA family ATPase n=1 Tax=Gluconacetobacter tumulisoli TaxID=1286189 RepID=A0A7W4K780_9PROT|nr:TniB family NTP-binding protein [Gluconacetobacter tumulisoli]MBB2201649.1 AAA family ATPase [Gluconacetobacter tumulisoli]